MAHAKQLYSAIPLLPSVEGWQSTPINECGEGLVSLEGLDCDRIVLQPIYHLDGLPGAISQMFLRDSAARRLVEAANNLPKSLKLVILDAWRPVEVQAELYHRTQVRLRALEPSLPAINAIALAEDFAAPPSLSAASPYPHSTGGAVDVTVMDNFGNVLNMGTEFDDVSQAAATEYFERMACEGRLAATPFTEWRDNRRLLFHSLTAAGFTNYKNEWWHYDYGNQLWAVQHGATARYGKTKPDDHRDFQILQKTFTTSNTK